MNCCVYGRWPHSARGRVKGGGEMRDLTANWPKELATIKVRNETLPIAAAKVINPLGTKGISLKATIR